MVNRMYDFFFGDQLRKHVVLISAFFLGQFFMIPFLGNFDPSQHMIVALVISFASLWPLTLLYDRVHGVRRKATEELAWETIQRQDYKLIGQGIQEINAMLYDMASVRFGGVPRGQMPSDIIRGLVDTNILSRDFLQNYEQFANPYRLSATSLRHITDLLNRLHFVSNANEKVIHELSLNFERVMLRKFDVLKEAGVPQEVIGRMIATMELHFHALEEFYNKEIERFIEENRR
jgi:hypothetical protein